tara:strand:+ start:8908 stop:9621 length:714 start_codon:yes stop_codon:yes gene_type:complete
MSKFFSPSLILLFFFLLSCDSPQLYESYPTPDQEILSGYENYQFRGESTEAFQNRLTTYNNILKTSPVPLFLLPAAEFQETYIKRAKLTHFAKKELAGLYVTNNKVRGWPEAFIYIKQELTPEEIISSFFHELGHHYCHMIKCSCLLKLRGEEGSVEAELHAMETEIREAIKLDRGEVLGISIVSLANHVHSKNEESIYKKAAIEMKDSKVFQDAIDYLSQKIQNEYVEIIIVERDD